MNEDVLRCVNNYLSEDLTANEFRSIVVRANMTEIDADDWRAFVPINLRLGWPKLSVGVKIGVALMAMGASVGAIGGPKSLT